MPQTVRMIMFPASRTADIVLNVCKIGNYMTAGTTERFVLMVSDHDNIRNLTRDLNTMATVDPQACLKLVLDGKRYSFDLTLWPEILDCLNDFFNMIDSDSSIVTFDDEY